MAVDPVAVRPANQRNSDAELPSVSHLGPPPPEHGFWARWWSHPRNRIRVGVSVGGLGMLVLYALFMDLTGR